MLHFSSHFPAPYFFIVQKASVKTLHWHHLLSVMFHKLKKITELYAISSTYFLTMRNKFSMLYFVVVGFLLLYLSYNLYYMEHIPSQMLITFTGLCQVVGSRQVNKINVTVNLCTNYFMNLNSKILIRVYDTIVLYTFLYFNVIPSDKMWLAQCIYYTLWWQW